MEKNALFSQRIRLRHLHTFVAVAQQGTLGRAAETLNLSQPALSKTLNELEQLTGREICNLSEALAACQQLREGGVELVMVKHLGRAGLSLDRFEMLLVCEEGAFHISRPLYEFQRQPIGVGDLLSATMLANLLAGFTPVAAFERTNASVDAVLAQTWLAGAYELQLVAAQQAMAEPGVRTRATRL